MKLLRRMACLLPRVLSATTAKTLAIKKGNGDKNSIVDESFYAFFSIKYLVDSFWCHHSCYKFLTGIVWCADYKKGDSKS
jgi:hypothetical protein